MIYDPLNVLCLSMLALELVLRFWDLTAVAQDWALGVGSVQSCI